VHSQQYRIYLFITVVSNMHLLYIIGRIVLYTALTRGGIDDRGKEEDTERNDNGTWNISGIELIPRLHDGAIQIVQT